MSRLFILLVTCSCLLACKQHKSKQETEIQPRDSLQRATDTSRVKDTATSAHYSQPGQAANANITRNNKGIGPVNRLVLADTINNQLVKQGKDLFANHCASCHRLHEALTGPALSNVLQMRSPEFVMNMILNTREMIEKDPTIQSLRGVYQTDMIQVDLTRQEARAIVEYLRTNKNVNINND